jgi:hypothetical protein
MCENLGMQEFRVRDLIKLTQDIVQWQSYVNMVPNIRGLVKWNLLRSLRVINSLFRYVEVGNVRITFAKHRLLQNITLLKILGTL